MEHAESNREPVEELAEEFVERQRRGERPTIEEYVDKHPDLADEIRELFPALRVMEGLKPDAADGATEQIGGSASVSPPKLLGDYRIVREVGRGGMGIVYEAEQQSLGRRVALKVLPHRLLVNEKQKKRFEHEARAAARLHHTNIVPVFGIGQHDGVYYYVMQFIQGQGLDEVLIEVQRLCDRGSSSQGAERTKSTERTLDEPTAQYGLETDSCAVAAQQAALSMVTGQFEGPQLSDSASSLPDDALTLGEQTVQRCESAEPASSGHGLEDERGSNASFSPSSSPSSSLSLVESSGTHSWSKSRSTYYRSVARIGVQAADALHYAHEQGVLHRDMKPSNLMLDTQGTLWITDFGLAKAEDQQSLTQTGDIVGTLRYMAPEMFSGRADARSDVCELGLTLYEMLALRPAYDETDRGRLVRQVMNQPPPRLQTLDRHLPRDLVTIIHKAIDRERATRYRTAAELRDDLDRFLLHEPIKARRISLTLRCGRWCRRKPVIALLAGTVAVLLLVVAIVSTTAAYRFRTLARELGEQKIEAEAAQEEALRNLWEAYRAQAQASRWSGRSGQRLDSLDALAKAAELVPRLELGNEKVRELRNEAIACMALADLRVVKHWESPLTEHLVADFSPDLKSYAEPDGNGNICIRRVADGQDILRFPSAGTPYLLRFSPDGRFLAVHREKKSANEVTVWDLKSRKAIFNIANCREYWGVAFSPDSRRLAADVADGSIRVYNVATGEESARLDPASPPAHICFHPDGRRLGVSSKDGRTVQIWDVETGRVLRTLPHPKGVMGIGWRADGKLLAAACFDSRIYVWEADSGTRQAVLEGHKDVVHHVAFHPTQNLLVSHAWDSTTRVWSLADGRQLLSVDGYFLRFDPEGRYLAFVNGLQIGLWEVACRPECETLGTGKELSEDVYGVAISPDGRLMASGGGLDCGVRLWDLATFRQVACLAAGTAASVRFHPTDGSLITSSDRGLFKWPIKRSRHQASNQLVVGPALPLGIPRGTVPKFMDMSSDGRTLVVEDADGYRAVVVHPELDKTTILNGGSHGLFIAVSPDGNWAARGNYGKDGVEVWDARTGKRVCDLPVKGTATVAFSPDGQWLVTAANVYEFWRTGSWQLQRSIPGTSGGNQGGRIAFSLKGKVMAITISSNLVQLIETNTGRVLADLEATPKPSWVQWLCFSSDGNQLATACGTEGIRVWDLRRIRQRLAAMHLDWDMPHYPPAVQAADLKPLQVEVNLGPLAGAAHRERSQNYAKSGQWEKAIEEATKAIELDPDRAEYRHCRGVVRARQTQWAEAAGGLQESDRAAARPNCSRLVRTGAGPARRREHRRLPAGLCGAAESLWQDGGSQRCQFGSLDVRLESDVG